MYLLDTSVVSAIFNAQAAKHLVAMTFRNSVGDDDDIPSVSVVTLSEMKFGLDVFAMRTPTPSKHDLAAIRQRIALAKALDLLPVTDHVADAHGQLRAKWAKHLAPNKLAQGKLKGTQPERWIQNWPAANLQITENDLWIAATALNHDLELVTIDGDFVNLRQAEPALRVKQI